MTLPDLDELATLEAIAGAAWLEVNEPTAAGESINPTVNREQRYIQAVRAQQAVAQWYLKHAEVIKELIRLRHLSNLKLILSHEPNQ